MGMLYLSPFLYYSRICDVIFQACVFFKILIAKPSTNTQPPPWTAHSIILNMIAWCKSPISSLINFLQSYFTVVERFQPTDKERKHRSKRKRRNENQQRRGMSSGKPKS
jgi:hypothetical protein